MNEACDASIRWCTDALTTHNTKLHVNVSRFVYEQVLEFQKYYYMMVIVGGLLGNTLACVVLLRSPKLAKSPTTVYLSALAMSDAIYLVYFFIYWLSLISVDMGTIANLSAPLAVYDLYNRDGFCEFFAWLSNACITFSTWLVMLFTIQRFIVVVYPMHTISVCTLGRTRGIVGVLAILACIYTSPIAVSTGINNTGMASRCGTREDWFIFEHTFQLIDTVVTALLPAIVVATLNGRICYTLFASSNDSFLRSTRQSGAESDRGGTREAWRIALTLLIISSIFFLLQLPHNVNTTIRFVKLFQHDVEYGTTEYVVNEVLAMTFYANFAIDFMLYNLASRKFRSCALELITSLYRSRCCCGSKGDGVDRGNSNSRHTYRTNIDRPAMKKSAVLKEHNMALL